MEEDTTEGREMSSFTPVGRAVAPKRRPRVTTGRETEASGEATGGEGSKHRSRGQGTASNATRQQTAREQGVTRSTAEKRGTRSSNCEPTTRALGGHVGTAPFLGQEVASNQQHGKTRSSTQGGREQTGSKLDGERHGKQESKQGQKEQQTW